MVLQDAEGTEFRASIADLVTVLKTPDGKAAPRRAADYTEETASSADEREALKRLDEPENLN